MWIGDGEFNSFGYQYSAYIKGEMEHLKPDQCYQIMDKGKPNTSDQYQFVPIDEQGHELGPPVLKTAGQAVYMTWETGRSSPAYNISNHFVS